MEAFKIYVQFVVSKYTWPPHIDLQKVYCLFVQIPLTFF